MRSPRVLQITSHADLADAELFARVASTRGAFAVQLRDPDLPPRALLALGQRLRRATRAVGASLVVNDRMDLAIALEADGIHLGRRSVTPADARALLGPNAWICVACHGVEDVVNAAREGADAVTLSPIFASPGKASPLGLATLTRARHAAPATLSILALGGITEANARACIEAGADGVAAIRGDLTRLLADGSLCSVERSQASRR